MRLIFNNDHVSIDAALRYDKAVELINEIAPRRTLRILETGSGTAGLTQFVRYPVTGIDAAFYRTRSSKSLGRFVPVQGEVVALPFSDDSFDVVLSLDMIEHLSPTQRSLAFAEMWRVMKPGGRAIIGFPAGAGAAQADTKINDAFRRRRGENHPWIIEHIEQGWPQESDIIAMLQQRGISFRVEPHFWVPAWIAMQTLYSVYSDARRVRFLLLRRPFMVRLAFQFLRRLNRLSFGPTYRSFFVLDKPA